MTQQPTTEFTVDTVDPERTHIVFPRDATEGPTPGQQRDLRTMAANGNLLFDLSATKYIGSDWIHLFADAQADAGGAGFDSPVLAVTDEMETALRELYRDEHRLQVIRSLDGIAP